MKNCLFYLSLLISSSSFSIEVPHIFVAGTAAKASEVNENFSALKEGIDNNKCSLQAVDKFNSFSATYIYKQADVGSTVSIDSKDYIVYKYPFVDHSSGEAYSIIVPAGLRRLEINSISSDFNCGTVSISGFPAYFSNINSNYGETFDVNSEGKLQYDIYWTARVNILVGGTLLRIHYYPSAQKVVGLQYNGEFDFTSLIDLSNVPSASRKLTTGLDDFIDYIKIEKIGN